VNIRGVDLAIALHRDGSNSDGAVIVQESGGDLADVAPADPKHAFWVKLGT
jgi:hypothetical protein